MVMGGLGTWPGGACLIFFTMVMGDLGAGVPVGGLGACFSVGGLGAEVFVGGLEAGVSGLGAGAVVPGGMGVGVVLAGGLVPGVVVTGGYWDGVKMTLLRSTRSLGLGSPGLEGVAD